MSGVVGCRRKGQRREREGRGYYRHARSTLSSRDKKKLLDKVTWFRGKRKRDEDEDEEESSLPARKRGKISRKMLARRKLQ